MRIASWNVNSIKQRIDNMVNWLSERRPDIVCLQETKCIDAAFPREPFEALGYNLAFHGQKTFNGVAILSKLPFDEVTPRLPGDELDEQARFLEVVVSTKAGAVRIASLYLPNGNPPRTEKYAYKLNWMERIIEYTRERLLLEEPLVLAGDFNVIPAEIDVHAKFRALMHLGLTDAVRAASDDPGLYTFWDYQAGAWQKNNGIRIDHLVLSPQATDRLNAVGIDKHVRSWEKPSDHVPVWADFAIEA